jgi:transposase InsO family protein
MSSSRSSTSPVCTRARMLKASVLTPSRMASAKATARPGPSKVASKPSPVDLTIRRPKRSACRRDSRPCRSSTDSQALSPTFDYVLEKLPFRVETIQTDNGAEFQGVFHWHVLDRGVGHTYIKPPTPRLNGKVERSHRLDAEEFYRQLEGVVIDDTNLFNDKLQEWENFYNFHRPHGGLGGQTPYERLRQRTKASA